MKTFKQYLMENVKEYKSDQYAGTLIDAPLSRLEMAVGKYNPKDNSPSFKSNNCSRAISLISKH